MTTSVAAKTPQVGVTATPVLKWPGGKAKLLNRIYPLVPEKFGDYHEPFVGGGAVFFALRSMGRISSAFLGDASPILVPVYQAIRDDVETVIRLLRMHASNNSQEYYYWIRQALAEETDSALVVRAARIMYLNKTCFNGLFRTNGKGQFNASWGFYKKPTILDEGNVRAVSLALQSTHIACEDFTAAVRAKPGDFVYFDPPYVPASESADFTEYTEGKFGLFEHKELVALVRALRDRGVFVLVSNSDTPAVRELYPASEFHLQEVQVARVINCHAEKRGKVGELLIRSW